MSIVVPVQFVFRLKEGEQRGSISVTDIRVVNIVGDTGTVVMNKSDIAKASWSLGSGIPHVVSKPKGKTGKKNIVRCFVSGESNK